MTLVMDFLQKIVRVDTVQYLLVLLDELFAGGFLVVRICLVVKLDTFDSIYGISAATGRV